MTVFRAIACWLLCVSAMAGQETSWPQYRGPNHDAHAGSENQIVLATNVAPRLLWRTSIGQGFSGFVIVGDLAYTLSQTSVGQYLICLDMTSGRVIWQTRLGFPAHLNDDYPGPYSTPAVDNGRVYYADCSGKVGCADATKGQLIWSLNLMRAVSGEGADFGYASSPLIHRNLLFLPAGGPGASMVALDPQSGAFRWKNGNDRTSYSSCFPITVEGHCQVIAFMEHAMVAHDPDTGAELWRDDWGSRGYAQRCAAPLYQEPYLFCSSAFRQGARVLKLAYDGSKPTALRVWESEVLCNDILSPVLVDGFVYGFDVQAAETRQQGGTKGEFKCVELSTGKTMWSSKTTGHCSALLFGNRLVLLNENGELITIDATPTGYRELSRASVLRGRTACWTAPVLCKNRLLLRNQQTVACYWVGPVKDAPAVVSTSNIKPETLTYLLVQDWLTWAQKHQDRSFWKPNIANFIAWYGWCLAVVASSFGLTLLTRSTLGRTTVLLVLMAVLGAVAMPLASFGVAKLVFTWPAATFALCFLAAGAKSKRSPTVSRGILALLIAGSLVYVALCRSLHIDSGIGFLFGFIVVPIFICQFSDGSMTPRRLLAHVVTSFTIYYWVSAAFIHWATS